ncbi:translation initiation factor IF-2 subunit alpha [Candidatus Woesearchaeota archaeon]|nr:translation initiation factor IF-2 subunit alpha [Candidatus Woesearchaeota archaeon]
MIKKTGMPEEGELVLCTITKIMYHSVFANLDEYDKSGMIHISEISPGRIRNIRDFVAEGKKVVCKILKIDREKGHIDLSLRRVNESQKREKLEEIKQEQKAEKIVEFVAQREGGKFEDLYNKIKEPILKKYDSLSSCFQEVVASSLSLESLGISKETADQLEEVIRQKIKPPEVELKGELFLQTYEPNGVDIIKAGVSKAEEKSDKVSIKYLGAGKYSLSIKAAEYKEAEKVLKQSLDAATKYMKKITAQ